MNSPTFASLIAAACIIAAGEVPASAATIYESASLGTTGITPNELLYEEVLGGNLSSGIFLGVRFELTRPVQVDRVGGHLIGFGPGGGLDGQRGEIFAAIVQLSDSADLPDSVDLSTPDVLGVATFTPPATSADLLVDLPLQLSRGWYALAFGSGLYGADGVAGLVANNTEDEMADFLQQQPILGGWAENFPNFRNYRLVVVGTEIPESSAIGLMTGLLLAGIVVRGRTSNARRHH